MLAAGTRIAGYEIVAAIGAGGMGEVYRARDVKLNREVAIKVLPGAFLSDGDRLARFKREAQLLASLNHPNIGAIYGFEEPAATSEQAVPALVLEFVEGPTLADRIAEGVLPVEEALPLARQIAEALEAAHEQGIVHRDLKPANIKLRPDGVVKVLDFGLAKAFEPAGAMNATATVSPTITSPAMTQVGVILGTAAYMSPEQAKGRPADTRSDLWAFGCVLYEMLAGVRPFGGDDVSEALAFVITKTPDWSLLPAATPATVRTLLRRCLEKDRKRRLASAADARIEIEDALALLGRDPVQPASPVRRPVWQHPAIVGVVGLVVGGAAGALMIRSRPATAPAPSVTRFQFSLPEGLQIVESGRRLIDISRDGSQVVYAANRQLYLRSMSDIEARPIRGTETPVGQIGAPVFSPDGRSIAYAAGRPLTIKRVAVGGGTPVSLCEAGTIDLYWDERGIVFVDAGQPVSFLNANTVPRNSRVMRVSSDGGPPETLFTVSDGFAQNAQLLPDGDSVLFTLLRGATSFSELTIDSWDKAEIVVQSLRSGKRRTLIEGGAAARHIPTGHIVYARGGVLFARRFDAQRLEMTGGPVPIVEGVRRYESVGTAQFAISDSGSLVYVRGPLSAGTVSRIGLLDQEKGVTTLPLPAAAYEFPRLSPDGRWLAVGITDSSAANIWIGDLEGTGSTRQLTSSGRNRFPIWSSDSRRELFQSDRDGDAALFWQFADGSGTAERLTKPDRGVAHVPDAATPDGKSLLFESIKDSERTLWQLGLQDKVVATFGKVEPSGLPFDATFSPNGRWVAYRGRGSAGSAVFVEPVPATGEKRLIAPGITPVWSPDGHELVIRQLTTSEFVAMSVSTDPSFTIGPPRQLPRSFPMRAANSARRSHDILSDGKRFISLIPADASQSDTRTAQFEVVLHWFEELKARMSGK